MSIKIKRKRGSNKSLLFRVNVGKIGKTLTDISNAFWVIKANKTDLDGAALMLKTTPDITYIQDPDDPDKVLATVPWLSTEYGAFTVGVEYYAGFFFQFIGDPVADEDVEQDFIVEIEQDILEA